LESKRRGLAGRVSVLHISISDRHIVDGFHVRSRAQVLDTGSEAFGPWEEEMVGERFVVFVCVGSGGEAFGRSEAGGFGEGDEPCQKVD
jgi:hypothetical protein